jgi:putative iron-only hydrogenase system regulator
MTCLLYAGVLAYIGEAASFLGAASFFIFRRKVMETRVAVISIIIEDPASVQAMNDILHQYAEYIIGRMGIPYREKKISIISVAMDAPLNVINSLSGKIGRLSGASAKAAYTK